MNEFQRAHGPIRLLIHGDANGLDRTAGSVAEDMGIEVQKVPAKWDEIDVPGAVVKVNKFGRKYNVLAGRWRNTEMIKVWHPDFGMVFPGGSGTAHMKNEMMIYGVPIWDATEL